MQRNIVTFLFSWVASSFYYKHEQIAYLKQQLRLPHWQNPLETRHILKQGRKDRAQKFLPEL